MSEFGLPEGLIPDELRVQRREALQPWQEMQEVSAVPDFGGEAEAAAAVSAGRADARELNPETAPLPRLLPGETIADRQAGSGA